MSASSRPSRSNSSATASTCHEPLFCVRCDGASTRIEWCCTRFRSAGSPLWATATDRCETGSAVQGISSLPGLQKAGDRARSSTGARNITLRACASVLACAPHVEACSGFRRCFNSYCCGAPSRPVVGKLQPAGAFHSLARRSWLRAATLGHPRPPVKRRFYFSLDSQTLIIETLRLAPFEKSIT